LKRAELAAPVGDAAVAIHVEEEPARATRALVLAELRAFNRRHAPPPSFLPLTLAARAGVELVGGLVGETGWEWLHVDLLWVEERHRGQGIGRRLLQAAEAEAARRGCRHVHLDTFDYQARPFYERQGYVLFGEQDDYPPGHRRFFLRKPLAPAAAPSPERA
jgi:GNAT superfamily N-acetyltransferase